MNSQTTRALLVLAVLLTLAACGRQQVARIFPENVAEEWEAARNAGDANATAEACTEDAQLMPPNAPVIEGREGVRTFWRNVFETRVAPAEFNENDIIVFRDFAYRQGTYRFALPDGTTEYGKFVQLWKFVKGAWKLHRMMWSPNGPPLPGDTVPKSQPAPG